ncbi:carbon-nitrogen family hydrolase [Virgibacillus doumboii]|uniref:carbon-nitrogen family hydrolase n=1 Tax=Virgibacillus doumboii TaxID=2697503 RepID=UPI0013E02C3E|nr:carbon-nitrogen family hydrolase [Virgibacillus doumboii]
MKKKIAMIQMDVIYGDPKVNFAHVSKKIMEAEQMDADIILLPELWDTGYDLERFDELADKDARASTEFLSDMAKDLDVTIIGGSVAELSDDGMRNTMLIVNQNGELVHKYSKLHLFQLMDEHLHLVEGQDEADFELDGVPSAGFICYDIRFPEWMRKSAVNGAKVMYVVAEWPEPRIDHWRALLQARAIENQCYVVACNRVGADPKNEFGGMSMIVDPWGEIVTEGGTDEGIVLSEIDLDKVDEVRNRIPIFRDRREERY